MVLRDLFLNDWRGPTTRALNGTKEVYLKIKDETKIFDSLAFLIAFVSLQVLSIDWSVWLSLIECIQYHQPANENQLLYTTNLVGSYGA